jgi:Cof subfamily protein (haloacid dehalogenase superfamily)
VSPIKLLLSDVDGTLVTSDKQLAPSTIAAVARLREHGVAFAVTSGRPPQGLAILAAPLAITTPMSAFNGGVVVTPEMSILMSHEIEPTIVSPLLATLARHQLSPWLFHDSDWWVPDRHGPHVDREVHASHMEPQERSNFDGLNSNVPKLVGVSDDRDAIEAGLADVLGEFGSKVSASSSQPYYLDVTHRDANKGWVVGYLAEALGLDPSEIATIGDGDNDVEMFERGGISIAMGNGSARAKSSADHVTTGNDDNGFARAIKETVLPAS